MKSLLRIMQELMAVWLICVLAGTSCAVFYTKSNDNDYPRIGRRAFFTDAGETNYFPRVGRAGFENDDSLAGFGGSSQWLDKRGYFTSGKQSYPRIGRGKGDGSSHQLTASATVVSSDEAPDMLDSPEQTFDIPVDLLFLQFDKDGDKTLTREEFVTGMSQAREDGTTCR